MAQNVKPVPKHLHTVTPGLVVKGADKAIDFYKRALGAEELSRLPGPDGRIMHAELKIGDSVIFLTEEVPGMGHTKSAQTLGGCSSTLNVYVPNVDETFKHAVSLGAKEGMPVGDQFWGDRYGTIVDPFGYVWGIATHKEDLSEVEIQQRAQEFFARVQQQKKTA